MDINSSPEKFENYLVSEYFRLGSIDKVLRSHQFSLPVSFSSYHRILSKFGVIKSAGPNSKISESIKFLTLLANYKIPLERVYSKIAPKSIQVSMNTLHRILHYVRLGLTRRQGTALLITSAKDKYSILTAQDESLTNDVLGKKGDFTLPMSHSKTGENPRDSIARVLQQEVFTDLLVNNSFPWQIIPKHPKPIMYINIADIRVSVYHIELENKYDFSSYKLKNYKYRTFGEIYGESIRPGVGEIIQKYTENLVTNNYKVIPDFSSNLNIALYALAKVNSNSKN